MIHEQALRFLHVIKQHVRSDIHAVKTEWGYAPTKQKLTSHVLENHLKNAPPIGAYLVTGDTVRAAVFDFDDHEGKAGWEQMLDAVRRVIGAARAFGLKPIAFRSGGGLGVHLWFLWHQPQRASDVRRHLQDLLGSVGFRDGASGGVAANEVEVYPRQNRVEEDKVGSLIALPGARRSIPLDQATLEAVEWPAFSVEEAATALSEPVPFVADEEVAASAAGFLPLKGDDGLAAEALKHIPADDYHVWLKVGFALKHAFGDPGFAMFDAWSSKSDKYVASEARQFWSGLRPDGRVNIGTVFYLAAQHGWSGSTNSWVREMNARFGIFTSGNTTQIIIKNGDRRPDDEFATLSKQVFLDRLAAEKIMAAGEDGSTKPRSKARAWLDHGQAAHYSRVDFDPSMPPGHNGRTWNMWTGFGVEPSPGNWSLLKEHIRDNICGGDDQLYQWLLNWMAFGVQHPGAVIGTAPVLIGLPGTGKGVLANAYGRLWGQHFIAVTHPEHVTGRFSGHLVARRFVFIDEGTFGGNRKEAGTIKTRITDPYVVLERKGHDALRVRNRMIFMIASNEISVVPADKNDRRWMVLEVGAGRREDRAYFEAIDAQLEQGGFAAMLHELLNRDVSAGPDPRKTIKTEALFEQVLHAQGAEVGYIHRVLENGRLPQNWVHGANSTTIRALMAELRQQHADARYVTEVRLGRQLRKMIPNAVADAGGKFCVGQEDGGKFERSTRYRFPPLKKARAAFENYLGVPIPWCLLVEEWQNDPEPEVDPESGGPI